MVAWIIDRSGGWIIDCSVAWIIDFSGALIIDCSGACIIDCSGAWIIDFLGAFKIDCSGAYILFLILRIHAIFRAKIQKSKNILMDSGPRTNPKLHTKFHRNRLSSLEDLVKLRFFLYF